MPLWQKFFWTIDSNNFISKEATLIVGPVWTGKCLLKSRFFIFLFSISYILSEAFFRVEDRLGCNMWMWTISRLSWNISQCLSKKIEWYAFLATPPSNLSIASIFRKKNHWAMLKQLVNSRISSMEKFFLGCSNRLQAHKWNMYSMVSLSE